MITPLSDSMKKGSEPLRSFSDLAQFLGHIQPIDPAEEKRRKKEEKLAQKREAEAKKAAEPVVEDMPIADTPVEDMPVVETPREVQE